MSHPTNPSSSSSDDCGDDKYIDLKTNILLGAEGISHFTDLLRSLDVDYKVPATRQEIIRDFKKMTGVNLNDPQQLKSETQKHVDNMMKFPKETEDLIAKKYGKLSLFNIVDHLREMNLHEVRENKQNLPSRRLNNQAEISSKSIDLGMLSHSEVQYWIKKMESVYEGYVVPNTCQEFIKDLNTKLGVNLNDIHMRVNNEIRKYTEYSNNGAPVPTLSKQQENEHTVSSSSSERESDDDVSQHSKRSLKDLSDKVLFWLEKKDKCFQKYVRGLSLSALLDLYNWEITHKMPFSIVSDDDHGMIPSTFTKTRSTENQNNSGIEFWLKMMGLDEKKFPNIPDDNKSHWSFVSQVDADHTISKRELISYKMTLVIEYQNWLKDESPDRDVKIFDSFQRLLPKLPESDGRSERMRFYADFSMKVLSDYAKRCQRVKALDDQNSKDEIDELNGVETSPISTAEKPLPVGLGSLSTGSFQSNEKEMAEDSDEGPKNDAGVLNSAEDDNADMKAELREIRRRMKDLFTINYDLRRKNQFLESHVKFLESNFSQIGEDNEKNSDRIEKLTTQMKKLTNFVKGLKK